MLVGVLLLLVVSAVAVGLAGSRDTNDKNPPLILGPVRHEATTSTAPTPTAPTPTAPTPTTTAAKQPTKTTRRPTPPASRPKTHAPARPPSKKEPRKAPARKHAKKPKHTRTRPPARPARPVVTGFVPARTWSWEPQPRARRYVFSLQRNGKHVISARTAKPRYVLPKRFRFAAGRYRWRVVAVTTKRGVHRKLLVDSKFHLSAAGAAAANR